MIKFVTFLCLFGIIQAKVSYHESQVLKIIPKTNEQLEALHYVEEHSLGAYNFWTGPTNINKPVHVMVPPSLKSDFQDILDNLNLESEVYIEDVQKLIDNERGKTRSSHFNWNDYYELDEIYAWLRELEASYPDVVTIVKGGDTFEGREILGAHVSFSPENAGNIFFIEGGIHAREWISPATVTYLLNEIVTSQNSTIRQIAEAFDWYIFPVFNPDGYVHTHTTNRMWRKTRVPYFLCSGADPNRNWDFEWMNGGSSQIPCAETFAGPTPFSEPSVRSMAEFITSIGQNLTVYISFHSFTQLILLPYGHTYQHLDNYDEAFEIGSRAAQALSSRYGTQYTVGSIAETIYIASGSSADWVKGTFGTRIVYSYELRDLGQFGFILPAEQIIPNCLEVLDSFIVISQAAIEF